MIDRLPSKTELCSILISAHFTRSNYILEKGYHIQCMYTKCTFKLTCLHVWNCIFGEVIHVHVCTTQSVFLILSYCTNTLRVISTDEWARPIFGLASDFKSLGRDEREERDYANLSQATKRRLRYTSYVCVKVDVHVFTAAVWVQRSNYMGGRVSGNEFNLLPLAGTGIGVAPVT